MANQSNNLNIQDLFDSPLHTIFRDIQDISKLESAHYCVIILCVLFERFNVDWLFYWPNFKKPIEPRDGKTFKLEHSEEVVQVVYRPNVLNYPGNPEREENIPEAIRCVMNRVSGNVKLIWA